MFHGHVQIDFQKVQYRPFTCGARHVGINLKPSARARDISRGWVRIYLCGIGQRADDDYGDETDSASER